MKPLAALLFCVGFLLPGHGAIAQEPATTGGQDAAPETPETKPSPFSTRRLGRSGSRTSQPAEKAILDGMRWQIRHQNPDGSWTASGIGARCRTSPPCIARIAGAPPAGDVGVTSLVLAGFLRVGFTPMSKQDIVDVAMAERHKLGTVIGRGVGWLVQQQSGDGTWPVSTCGLENQSLATLVLSETLRSTGDPALQAPAQLAVDALQRAQRADASGDGRSGWNRCASPLQSRSAEPADISATAWAVQALVAARDAGLSVDARAFFGAVAFGDEVWRSLESGTGVDARLFPLAIVRILARPVATDPVLARVVDTVRTAGKSAAATDAQHALEQSFVMEHLRGDARTSRDSQSWSSWYDEVPAAIVAAQASGAKFCHHGGWIRPEPSLLDAGPAAWTALRILALENYYCYESKLSAPKPK